jgi:hypothetical protein
LAAENGDSDGRMVLLQNVVKWIEFLEGERIYDEFEWAWEIVAVIDVMTMGNEL